MYKNVERQSDREPHLYWVADHAYRRMVAMTTKQCILVNGESGAGKTEATKSLLKHLVYISQSTVANLHERVVKVSVLLFSLSFFVLLLLTSCCRCPLVVVVVVLLLLFCPLVVVLSLLSSCCCCCPLVVVVLSLLSSCCCPLIVVIVVVVLLLLLFSCCDG